MERSKSIHKERRETGATKKDLTVPVWKAFLFTVALLPLVLLLYWIYLLIWDPQGSEGSFGGTYGTAALIAALVVVYFGGVIVHELIHGLCFAYFGGKPLSSVEFGMHWKMLSAYASLPEPIPARAYRIGTAMPGLVLGVVPYLVGLATGNVWVTLFGVVFTWSAGGDALILLVMRGVGPRELVEDSPTRVGCYVLE
jgi:hypothetical protein